MNIVNVLKVMVPVLNIVSALASAYVSKHTMQHMIREEVAKMIDKI